MSTPFNDHIVRAQLRNTLVTCGIPHDPNGTLVGYVELDDGEWSAEYRFSGLRPPVFVHIKKSYMESELLRLPVYKVATTHIGPDAPWLKDVCAATAPVEPPKLAAVPEPEE